jgi:hypothetical protein
VRVVCVCMCGFVSVMMEEGEAEECKFQCVVLFLRRLLLRVGGGRNLVIISSAPITKN